MTKKILLLFDVYLIKFHLLTVNAILRINELNYVNYQNEFILADFVNVLLNTVSYFNFNELNLIISIVRADKSIFVVWREVQF